MRIADNRVALIDYTLYGPDGEVIDSTAGGEPVEYLHGAGNLIEGLERALTSAEVGDELEVVVSPAEGYGDYDDSLVWVVPRSSFGDNADQIEVGMQFRADDAGADVLTVAKVNSESVTLDGNHPLAGLTLRFVVKVVGVREATPDEIEHGHVHGPDGHLPH